jgi:hypothetical protein
MRRLNFSRVRPCVSLPQCRASAEDIHLRRPSTHRVCWGLMLICQPARAVCIDCQGSNELLNGVPFNVHWFTHVRLSLFAWRFAAAFANSRSVSASDVSKANGRIPHSHVLFILRIPCQSSRSLLCHPALFVRSRSIRSVSASLRTNIADRDIDHHPTIGATDRV